MKLQAKLVWAGILIVLIPMLLSAVVMWRVIQWQNTEDARQYSGNLIDTIRQELESQAITLVNEMELFAQDPRLLRNIMFLSQTEGAASEMEGSLHDFYKTQMGLLMANFANVNTYNILMVFDQGHQLVSYIKFDDEHYLLGIVTQKTDGTTAIDALTQESVILGNEDVKPDDWRALEAVLKMSLCYSSQ
jgi:hypothetical protein